MGLREERRRKLAPVVRQALVQAAESCERALRNYAAQVGMDSGHELFRDLLRAIATMQTTVDLLNVDDSRSELALQLTAHACTAAAAGCRRAGFDEALLRCAAACDRAADEANLALTSLAR